MAKSSSCAEHYRAVALRFRERAAATPDPQLRDSYLDLATDYERLADLLEAEDRTKDGLPGSFARAESSTLTQAVRSIMAKARGADFSQRRKTFRPVKTVYAAEDV